MTILTKKTKKKNFIGGGCGSSKNSQKKNN